jgi:hypothetical protein
MPERYNLYEWTGVNTDLVLPHWRLRSVDGLGMPEVAHISERYAQQDGATYQGTRLKKRIVTLTFHLVEDSESDLWDARDELLRAISDFGHGFEIYVFLPNGDTRAIGLQFDSGLSMPRDLNQNLIQQECVLQCVAHDPLLYDPYVVWLTYNQSALGVVQVVPNAGTWATYPTIFIDGPLTDPVIENQTTGEILDLTGFTLLIADVITITLTPGAKAITCTGIGNILPYLSTASNLATWHLGVGDNDILWTGSGAMASTSLAFSYYRRYIGI